MGYYRFSSSRRWRNHSYNCRCNNQKIIKGVIYMIKTKISLKSAADAFTNPNTPGVYILYLNGQIMKVGSAEIGVQKRMQQYYGLNSYCGLNKHINENNRDNITVTFQTCNSDQCNELESKLFDKYGSVSNMPWATRRPHSTQNTCQLLI